MSSPSHAPRPSLPVDTATRRLARRVFFTVWFVIVPAALAALLVWLLQADEGTARTGLGSLAWLIREQPIPAGIVFFMLGETLLYRSRFSLPGAGGLTTAGRAGVPRELRERVEAAQALLDDAERLQRKHAAPIAATLSPAEREDLAEKLDGLRVALDREPIDARDLEVGLTRAAQATTEHLGRWRKGWVREYGEAIIVALAVALLLRLVVFEPFRIPTGSMLPTLELGDHIFVNKLAYGVPIPGTGKRLFPSLPPARGDILVFRYPENRSEDFVKRTIGLPGDVITVRAGHPLINGWEVPSCYVGPYSYWNGRRESGDLYVEFLGERAYSTLYMTGGSGECTRQCPFTVPEGEVFMMGDNRFNSRDSREWGGVPFADIKGRAVFIWLSTKPDGSWWWSRWFSSVTGNPEPPDLTPELKQRMDACLTTKRPTDTTPPGPKAIARP